MAGLAEKAHSLDGDIDCEGGSCWLLALSNHMDWVSEESVKIVRPKNPYSMVPEHRRRSVNDSKLQARNMMGEFGSMA